MIIKSIAEKTLERLLAMFARSIVGRYRPRIIAVTGTAGKTSTKDAIYALFGGRADIRCSEKSFNTEIGVPLTIIGGRNHHKNIFGWCAEFFRACMLLVHRKAYPAMLILEYGVQKPGDMAYLTEIAAPDIAVITAFGETPVHVEFFKNPEELFSEKGKIAAALSGEGTLVLNADDLGVCAIRKNTKARILTFGFSEEADIQISQMAFCPPIGPSSSAIPEGISFVLKYHGVATPVRIHAFGRPQAYAAGAAAAVGIATGMGMDDIARGLLNYASPPGRLNILRGINGSVIIDDTYNSSPIAAEEALNVLREFSGGRKIAVLGDMKELGSYTEKAHRVLGGRAAGATDMVIAIGAYARWIAEEARASKKGERDGSIEAVREFSDAVSAGAFLGTLLGAGDVVLVKGSRSMGLEKTVYEIMADKEKAEELLVQ